MGDHLTTKELNISLRSLGRIQKQSRERVKMTLILYAEPNEPPN